MKSTIITALLALIAIVGQAKDIVWEQPSAFMGDYNSEFDITKVELKSTETVLHVTANYRPGNWIRFAKESFLQTPDGKKYESEGIPTYAIYDTKGNLTFKNIGFPGLDPFKTAVEKVLK